MKRICREAPFPQLANMISFGLTPEMTARELQEIGYAAAAWPVASIFAVTRTLESVMQRLLDDGKTAGAKDAIVSFDEFTTLMGLPGLREREQRFLDAEQPASVEASPTLRGGEQPLVLLFLRRYIAYCARGRRYAQMEGSARLHRLLSGRA